ncbi:MAG: kelch repeat-containing protein [Chloroflexota bacterium]
MKWGLLASLACLVLSACSTGGPTPTTSSQPTPTLAAQPTASATVAPTASRTAPATSGATPGVTPSPAPADLPIWSQRSDVAAGPSAREDHTWTVNGDGSVAYLFGGRSTDGLSNELWAFDLVSDQWALLTPTGGPPAPRLGHTATWVPNVGLVVWSGQGSDFFADIWAYDPLTNAWHELPSLGDVPVARYGSCASLGPDGRLWISHGFTQDSGRFSDTRAYDFSTGTWTDMTPAGDVPVKRCLHDCYWSSNQLILYGGQTTGVLALGDLWAYSLDDQTWREGNSTDAPPRQLYALGTGLGDSGVALVLGGGSLDGGYLDDAWAIDPQTLDLVPRDVPGPRPAARSGATLITDPDGRYLVFGGQNGSGLLADLWELSGPV